MKKIFAFDMGKASIGFCVREDNNILTAGSVIIEKEHANVADNRKRRRAKRTLDAHRAREKWFNDLWQTLGLNLLSKDDEKFKREFPSKGDDTIYNSCLLRIALLQDRQLEEWQIYKALHSAIQRRGYDSNVAWKSVKTEDDTKQQKRAEQYTKYNDKELINDDKYKYPCYYDAVCLGLWEESNPTVFKRTLCKNPIKVRSERVATRELVVKELKDLWIAAQKQLPKLREISTETFLYGDYQEAYGSFVNPEWRKYMGKKEDWQGVLGQKIPRFNNRIISKCKLLPKRNVCSADSLENIVFTLLMQLKNFRYIDENNQPARLAPFEIKQIYDNKITDLIKNQQDLKLNNKKHDFTITKSDIEKIIGKGFVPKDFEKIKANTSGRSSFCRRAMQIMTDIILSGDEPVNINASKYADVGVKTEANPITEVEIREMLSKIGSWNELHIPDNRYEMEEIAKNGDIESDLMIGTVTNPVVRNRLQIFKNLFIENINKYGMPDKVIFEFVRDGADSSLYGQAKAKANKQYMDNQEKENDKIKKVLGDNYSPRNFLMYKLAEMQDWKCIYSYNSEKPNESRKISISDFNLCDIDHIYPRTDAGNDALFNKVVCFYTENRTKKGKTPYEWLSHDEERWNAYVTRVQNLSKKLGKKKTALLTMPPEQCEKIMDSYNGLAETAQVSRIAQKIAAHIMGIGLQTKDETRRIFTNNGASTHKIRRQFDLNKLLGDDEKKNRENPKHHALDAICISYSQDLKYDTDKHKYIIDGFDVPQIKQIINDIVPFPYTHKKPLKSAVLPLETVYGKRPKRLYNGNNEAILTIRKSLVDDLIPTKKQDKYKTQDEFIKKFKDRIEKIIDVVIKEDLLILIEENKDCDEKEWKSILSNYVHPKKKTLVKKVRVEETSGEIEFDNNGRERIGEYIDFGTKGVKGQFKHSKQHKGQILYFDTKGTIRVKPIYANRKTQDVKNELINMGCKLYRGGEIFRSGILVHFDKDFSVKDEIFKAGIYRLRTIREDRYAEIENNIGQKKLIHLKFLTDAGFKKYKENK